MSWYGLAKDTTSKLVILNGDSVLLVCHRTIQSRVATGALESVISGVFDGWWHDLTWKLYRCIASKILQIILWVVSVPVKIQPLQVEMDDSIVIQLIGECQLHGSILNQVDGGSVNMYAHSV